jgi:type IV fimbrial biogenesis protein FimT
MNIVGKISPNLRAAPEKIRSAAGFTLIELLVVLSIAVILVLVAAPSFSYLIANRSAKSAASELLSSLQRARSEAIARNANVTLSPISGSWQNGWQVLGPTSTVLDTRPLVKGATVTGPTSVVYRSSGRITATTAPSFLFTATGADNVYQCVSVDLTGRPYMKAASSC